MKMKVIECEGIFKFPYKKELFSLHKGELTSDKYMGVIDQFCQRYIQDEGKAFIHMLI